MELDDHVIDDLPAYALGILDEDEALKVDQHLAVCDFCREERLANQEVVEALSMAVPLVQEPPRLKASVMKAVAAEAGKVQTPEPRAAGQARPGIFQRWLPAWGVVSLLLILVLGVANVFLWGQLRDVNSALQSSLQVVTLSGTEFKPDAAGLMVVGGHGDVGALIVDNLPPLDEAYEYQIWMIGEERRDTAGVFSVSEEGYGVKYVYSDTPLLSYKGFAITIEPAGGSPSPTGEQVLSIDF